MARLARPRLHARDRGVDDAEPEVVFRVLFLEGRDTLRAQQRRHHVHVMGSQALGIEVFHIVAAMQLAESGTHCLGGDLKDIPAARGGRAGQHGGTLHTLAQLARLSSMPVHHGARA